MLSFLCCSAASTADAIISSSPASATLVTPVKSEELLHTQDATEDETEGPVELNTSSDQTFNGKEDALIQEVNVIVDSDAIPALSTKEHASDALREEDAAQEAVLIQELVKPMKTTTSFMGVGPLDFAIQQKRAERDRKEKERTYRQQMANVRVSETFEINELNAIFSRSKNDKQLCRDTKKEYAAVNVSESVETNRFKEMCQREKSAKELSRNVKKENASINVSESVETNQFKKMFQREQTAKELSRNTKASLKDFNLATAFFKPKNKDEEGTDADATDNIPIDIVLDHVFDSIEDVVENDTVKTVSEELEEVSIPNDVVLHARDQLIAEETQERTPVERITLGV